MISHPMEPALTVSLKKERLVSIPKMPEMTV